MASRLLLAVASILLVHVIAELPADVQSGYFAGRSGNVVFKPKTAATQDAMAMFVDKTNRGYFQTSQSNSELSITNVADVITRSLGVQPVNEEFTPEFVTHDLFDRPRANLLVSVAGLGAESLANLPQLSALQSSAVSKRLSFESYPSSHVALSASIASGRLPAQHGVVAQKWMRGDQTVKAMSDALSTAQVANVADILSQTYRGQSLVLSASACRTLAAASCPNPQLLAAHPSWNSFCATFDSDAQSFTTIADNGNSEALAMTAQELVRIMSDPHSVIGSLSGAVSVAVGSDGLVTVTANGQSAQFDLQQKADLKFLVELQYALSLPQRLAVQPLSALVSDKAPDFYALTLSGLGTLYKHYGADARFQVAAQLVDAVLPKILEQFSALYPNAFVAEVVLLGSTEQKSAALAVISAVRDVLPSSAAAFLENTFPYAFVAEENAQLTKTCERLSQRLDSAHLDYSVHCATSAHSLPEFMSLASAPRFTVQAAASPQNATRITDDDLQRYQVILWTSVALAFILLTTIYSIAYMDFKKDTLLYGTFNPTWEDRKKGR